MDEPVFPHEIITARLLDTLGRRVQALGVLGEEMLVPLARGLLDQLSAYLDCRPTAKLHLCGSHMREGDERAYLFIGLRDRNGPLRLRAAMEYWNVGLVTSREWEWVEANNARRYRFIDRHRTLLADLGRTVADAVLDYHARKPGARLRSAADAAPRIVEGVDQTFVVVELDDRRDFLGAPKGMASDERRFRMQ